MSNDVVTTNPNAGGMTPAQRRDMILKKAQERRVKGEAPQHRQAGAVFAKLDGNNGKFTAGRQGTPIPADQKFVLVVDACAYERPLWAGGKVTKRLTTQVLDGDMPDSPAGEPRVGELPKPRERDGWGESINLILSGIDEGDFDGVIVKFECGNMSQLDAANELLSNVFDQIDTEEGQDGLFLPIVTIEIDSYFNKAYSRDIYFPVFTIHEWTDLEGSKRVPAITADDADVLG